MVDETTIPDATYMLSKLELCNICYFEDFYKLYGKAYYNLPYDQTHYWLQQFFHKLPSPSDELAIK